VSVLGVDVAAFQHPNGAAIPWASWYAAGFRIAYVQATQGTGIHNAYFAQDVRDARAAGFRVGAYHLCYPALNPNPASEWAYFSAAVAGVTLDLPPMLDDEEIGGLSWVELRTWVLGWLALAGPSALHYSNQNYLTNLNAAGGIPYRQWTARPGATSLAAGDIATQYGAGPIAGSQSVDQDYFDPSILPDPPEAAMRQIIFSATIVNQVPGSAAPGGVVDLISDGTWFRWIETPAVLADIQNNVGPVFNGQPVATWAVGTPVADLSCFGRPQDQITATMLGLPFGPTIPAGLTAAQATQLADADTRITDVQTHVDADLH